MVVERADDDIRDVIRVIFEKRSAQRNLHNDLVARSDLNQTDHFHPHPCRNATFSTHDPPPAAYLTLKFGD